MCVGCGGSDSFRCLGCAGGGDGCCSWNEMLLVAGASPYDHLLAPESVCVGLAYSAVSIHCVSRLCCCCCCCCRSRTPLPWLAGLDVDRQWRRLEKRFMEPCRRPIVEDDAEEDVEWESADLMLLSFCVVCRCFLILNSRSNSCIFLRSKRWKRNEEIRSKRAGIKKVSIKMQERSI